MITTNRSLITTFLFAIVFFAARRTYRYLVYKASVRKREIEHGCKPPKDLPGRDPFLGLDMVIKVLIAQRQHRALDDFASIFRDLNVNTFRFRVLRRAVVSTIEPENIKAVLSLRFQDFGLGEVRVPFQSLLGEGIFTSDGAVWQNSRNMLRPFFSRSQLADLSSFEYHVNRFLQCIPRDGSTVDLQPLFFRLTVDVATEFLLGQSTNCLSDKDQDSDAMRFASAFDRSVQFLATGGGWGILGFYFLKSKFKLDCQFIHDFVDSFIERALSENSSHEVLSEPSSRSTFLHELIRQTDDKIKIRTEVLNILLAGRDTTASFLSDLWFELSRHPAVFERLRAEVGNLDLGEGLTFQTFKSMPYLRAVVNENLRIHPVVPENSRIANKDTILPLGGGADQTSPVFVAKDQVVSWCVYEMHRRKDIFGDDADIFRPERWLDEGDQKGIRPGWGFLPFNGGPRICIGQQFALSEASYVTVRLMQAISSLESRDNKPWREKLSLTVTGLGGCKVALHFK